MFRNLVKQNSDKNYPSLMGQKWTEQEEKQLLEELEKNMKKNDIATKHNRTVGGISSRIREIAYKMYLNKIPMDDIIKKTKLSKEI
jgi:hypothetical protein